MSSARNAALDAIENDGTFDGVCFVDSDDIVKPDFISTFIQASAENNADFVICGYVTFDKSGFDTKRTTNHSTCTIDREGAFRHFFLKKEWSNVKSKTFSGFLSNRYYSASCLSGMRFNESMHRAEDTDFLFRSLRRVHKGVVLNSDQYLYRIRNSSLSHHESANFDIMKFNVQTLTTALDFPSDCLIELEKRAIKSWWRCVCMSIAEGTFADQRKNFESTLATIKSHRFAHTIPVKLKVKIALFSIGDPWLSMALKFRKKERDKRSEELAHAFE